MVMFISAEAVMVMALKETNVEGAVMERYS
jgi:hypothetical protein